jgi:hypothetical protein
LTVIVYRILSNIEKEKLVIDLYYNQQKNVRQIAQEARMSFRDIAAILKKKEAAEVNDVGNGNGKDNQQQQQSNDSNNTNNNRSPNEKSTQAYKLYSEGYKPVEVATNPILSNSSLSIGEGICSTTIRQERGRCKSYHCR